MHRLLLALPLALLLIAVPAHAEPASVHVAAARKAAKANNWNKALEEWKLAYRIEPSSEFLIGMGDAYAAMGDKANARKQYNAYLADPLALESDAVKAKVAALNKPAGGDDLALDLSAPPAGTPAKGKKGKQVAAADLSLDLSGPPVAAPKPASKATASNDLSLDFGGPPAAAPPPKPASKATASNDLSLDLGGPPAAAPPAKPASKATASNDLSLDLGGPPPPAPKPGPKPVASNDLSLDLGPAPGPPPKPTASTTPSKPASGSTTSSTGASKPPSNSTAVAAATTPKPSTAAPAVATTHTAPPEAVASVHTEPRVVERNNRVIAYCAAGLAVGAFAVGGIYYSKANSAESSVTNGSVNGGSSVQAEIDQDKKSRSLALAGVLTGVVLAGVATAIFVF